MSGLPCAMGAVEPVQLCEYSCTRWTGINQGAPILYYHDTSGWDPDCYPGGFNTGVAIDAADPQVYLQPAIDAWQSGVPCRTLFQRTFDRSEAMLIIQHAVGDGTIAGNATCFCDVDDDVCVRQVDHSQFFNAAAPAVLNIFCNGAVGGGYLSVAAYINLYMHELGHILGMGHVRNQTPPVVSVMGNPANLNSQVVLYDFDRDQLQARYPCGCLLPGAADGFIDGGLSRQRPRPAPSPQFDSVVRARPSSDVCPGCFSGGTRL